MHWGFHSLLGVLHVFTCSLSHRHNEAVKGGPLLLFPARERSLPNPGGLHRAAAGTLCAPGYGGRESTSPLVPSPELWILMAIDEGGFWKLRAKGMPRTQGFQEPFTSFHTRQTTSAAGSPFQLLKLPRDPRGPTSPGQRGSCSFPFSDNYPGAAGLGDLGAHFPSLGSLSLPLLLPLPRVHWHTCSAQHPLGSSGSSATLSQNGHSQPQYPEDRFSSWPCYHPFLPQSLSQVQREQVGLGPKGKFPPSAFATGAPPPCPIPSLTPSPIPPATEHLSLIALHQLPSWCLSQGGQRAQLAWSYHSKNERPRPGGQSLAPSPVTG